MKAKTIVGLMACAVFASAFADNNNPYNVATTNDAWFVGNVVSSAPAADGAAWARVTSADVDANNKIQIDADAASAVTLTPTVTSGMTAADRASDGLVIVTSSAYLTPSDKVDLPAPSTLTTAQVGFAVAVNSNVTNYYAYVRKGETSGETPVAEGEWIALSGATPPDGETDTAFKIVLDYQACTAKFFVTVNNVDTILSGTPDGGSSTDTFTFVPVTGSAKLTDVAAFGSGTITEIRGAYENAVAVKNGVKYAKIADAYNATGNYAVEVWDPTTGDAAAQQTAANGLSKAACVALGIPESGKLPLEPAAQNVSGKVVLKTSVDPVDGVTAKFTVSKIAGEAAEDTTKYNHDSIQLPLTEGQYQVIPEVSGVTP